MQRIAIQTTQNVSIDYDLASLKDRFMAMLIDILIFYFAYLCIMFLIIWFLSEQLDESGMFPYVLFLLFPIVGFMGYHLISEIAANGQSLGKKIIGLKVVRVDGREVGFSDFLLRAVFHLVETFFSMGIIAAVLISSSEKKQRLGDMTAGTAVIKLNSFSSFKLEEILKMSTMQDYVPVYADVKDFDESDMLLIKVIVSRYRRYPNSAHKLALTEAVDRFSELLDLQEVPANKLKFLETLLKDYVVLTR